LYSFPRAKHHYLKEGIARYKEQLCSGDEKWEGMVWKKQNCHVESALRLCALGIFPGASCYLRNRGKAILEHVRRPRVQCP